MYVCIHLEVFGHYTSQKTTTTTRYMSRHESRRQISEISYQTNLIRIQEQSSSRIFQSPQFSEKQCRKNGMPPKIPGFHGLRSREPQLWPLIPPWVVLAFFHGLRSREPQIALLPSLALRHPLGAISHNNRTAQHYLPTPEPTHYQN